MKENENKEHHIWCNYFRRPRKGCKLCERLYREYPSEGLTPEELVSKYFPNAIIRK